MPRIHLALVAAMLPLLSTINTARAEAKVFQGQAHYEISQKPGPLAREFTPLEKLGVEREAEQDAISNCIAATREKCFALTVSSRCNYRIPPKSVFDPGSTACTANASAATARDLQ